VLWVTGTASVFLWGAVGGLTTQIVANVVVIIRQQRAGKGFPKRFKGSEGLIALGIAVAGSAFLGGIVAWFQADRLVDSHQLAVQVGLGWPAFFSAVTQKQDTGSPGTVS
jgi:hypothetical protein